MSNLEQQVPSLNACLSLLARGITMMTVFCWARDDDGNFLVVSMYGAKPDRHVTPLCDAPRSKELLQALLDFEPSRFDASCMALFNQPEKLASLLLEAPMADYGHMSLGLLLAIQEGRGMQMMTGPRAWSKEEGVALESAVRQSAAREGSAVYQSSKADEVAWVFRCIRENWHTWGDGAALMRLMKLDAAKERLTEAGIEEICSPPCIGDDF
ncbi:hypothetical protein SMC3_08305 [Candidatus Cryosericum hinesii]|jgi:hypothetical protein|uniref:Uncharacterized protein n=1 Tax=Candidatus Cryosericum hinesii TaxID=2290915 RepID=A0A398DAY9_9BACT|nr:hypothetical protein [Candidatus Cryosericum hinesii]RIE11780.1 hypothetical protein SMC3_08305 [Candidatus Cryosericum hinesii]